MPQYWTVDSAEKLKTLQDFQSQALLAGKTMTYKIEKPESHITQKQVNALNLWCRQAAEAMREAGLDMKQVIRIEIPATEQIVKENLYKAVLQAQTGKKSTMDQDTVQPSQIVEILARHFAQEHGVILPEFPRR